MVEDVALDFVAAIGDGFATSKFAAGFDLNLHRGSGDE